MVQEVTRIWQGILSVQEQKYYLDAYNECLQETCKSQLNSLVNLAVN